MLDACMLRVCVEKCYFKFLFDFFFFSDFHHMLTFFFISFLLQPAAVEDLRKWTSHEAIGDVTVGCDGLSRVLLNSTLAEHDTSERPVSQDSTDAIRVMHESQQNTVDEEDKDSTVDYRLPSPEEQCKILAAK